MRNKNCINVLTIISFTILNVIFLISSSSPRYYSHTGLWLLFHHIEPDSAPGTLNSNFPLSEIFSPRYPYLFFSPFF